VKIPVIPLPEPAYIITVSHPNPRIGRVGASALRFLLWGTPVLSADYILATADGGRHALWLTLAATYVVLAIAMLTVGVEAGGGGEDRT
jgi:hypothetical protein